MILDNIISKIIKNKDNAIVILDFDHTITNLTSNTSIGVFTNYLPPKYKTRKKVLDVLTNKAHSRIMYHIIWKYKLKNLSKYYSKDLLKTIDFKKEFRFNSITRKLLLELSANNIPIVIYSSGMKDIIKEFLEINKITRNVNIIANSIDFDTKKISKPIITPKKKVLKELDKSYKYKYVFGDRKEDLKVLNNCTKFLVFNNRFMVC